MAEALLSQRISNYLRRKGSPLAPYANDFVRAGQKYGIDPRFLVAVSGIETGFGRAGSGLANPFGYMSAKRFSGPREVLDRMGRELTKPKGYYDGRNTINQIGATWAPPRAANDAGGNAGWPAAVRRFYQEQGGNPNAVVKGSGRGAAGPVDPTDPVQQVSGQIPGGQIGAQNLQALGATMSPQVIAAIKAYSDRSRAAVKNRTYTRDNSQFEAIKKALVDNIRQQSEQAGSVVGSGQAGALAQSRGNLARGGGGAVPGASQLDYASSGTVVRPLPTKLGGGSYGYSDAEGQGGRHLAHDWFAPANTAVASPVSGTVFRVKADPNPGKSASGQIFGGSVYIKADDGKVWVFRHMAVPEQSVRKGQRVKAGQKIGGVKSWGKSSHTHVELYKPGPYSYSPSRALNPWEFFRKQGVS
jgi:murein DD-endopeptidase MepM/ murein hydrolase activator NlpD